MVLQPARADVEKEEADLTGQIAYCQKWLGDFIVEERKAEMGLAPPIQQDRRQGVQRIREWLDELQGRKVKLDF